MIKSLALWAVAGVLVGLPLDLLHVASGVLRYTPATSWMPFGLQAWWAVPLFAGAGAALGLGHRHGATRIAAATGAPSMPVATGMAALAGVVALVFAYASSNALAPWPVTALMAYVAVWLFVVARVHPDARRALVLHSLGTAVVGPVVEALLVSQGMFEYAHPDVAGVAFWLPGIYLNAGAAAHLLDRHQRAREMRIGA